MTIQKTIEAPASRPAGTAKPGVIFNPAALAESTLTQEEALAKVRSALKGSTFTVDKLLEERRKETLREEEEHERLFHGFT